MEPNRGRYLDLLIQRRVRERMRSWYLRRVEAFLKALRPESLSRLTAEQRIGCVSRAPGVALIRNRGCALTRRPVSAASGYASLTRPTDHGLASRCLNWTGIEKRGRCKTAGPAILHVEPPYSRTPCPECPYPERPCLQPPYFHPPRPGRP